VALLVIDRGHITGFGSEEAVLARFAVAGLDLQGLVLAGLIIATLGVLDDVTISQASTVFALHDTDPRLGWPALFARAMKVGRDHIASVVNTLFLAYAGASLALLVLFSTGGLPVAQILNAEVLAEEIVKTVVGSLGLIAAVPLTTALAAAVAVRRPAGVGAPAGDRHGHAHGVVTTGSGAVPVRASTPPSGTPAAAPPPPTTVADPAAALLAAVDARIDGSVDDEVARWQTLRRSLVAVGADRLDGVLAEVGPAVGGEPGPRGTSAAGEEARPPTGG
jgi:amino acid transporter